MFQGILILMANPEEKSEGLTASGLIDSILQESVAQKASDVHIEPTENEMRIRFRIDGVLQEVSKRPIHELEPVLNTIKVMSGIDPMSHMEPKDGHFASNVAVPGQAILSTTEAQKPKSKIASFWAGGGDDAVASAPTVVPKSATLDVRVSIFPTVYGEAVAMRLLNTAERLKSVQDLGFGEDDLPKIQHLMTRAYGMVLVTGPTGSGKTTTIYSILSQIVRKDRNIITLEDPVELRLPGVRQSEIHPEQGFTYARAMRSILRQDPDVIMVGEVRDPETAEYAIRASLAGRIVFSTIHSNTTIGCVARLVDMSIERSLIAYSLNGIISQRLVRKLCPDCKQDHSPTAAELAYFKIDPSGKKFYAGAGCATCGGSGFKGRAAIFEILEFTTGFRSLVIDRAPMEQLQAYAEKNGMRTLKQEGAAKALAGITSLEEVLQSV